MQILSNCLVIFMVTPSVNSLNRYILAYGMSAAKFPCFALKIPLGGQFNRKKKCWVKCPPFIKRRHILRLVFILALGPSSESGSTLKENTRLQWTEEAKVATFLAGVHIPLNKIYLKLYITQYVHIFRNKYTRCLHYWVKEVFCAIMR